MNANCVFVVPPFSMLVLFKFLFLLQGDSGGPLICQGVQHGVVSWSFKPCTSQNRPGVYTRVASHLQWIKKQLETM